MQFSRHFVGIKLLRCTSTRRMAANKFNPPIRVHQIVVIVTQFCAIFGQSRGRIELSGGGGKHHAGALPHVLQAVAVRVPLRPARRALSVQFVVAVVVSFLFVVVIFPIAFDFTPQLQQ